MKRIIASRFRVPSCEETQKRIAAFSPLLSLVLVKTLGFVSLTLRGCLQQEVASALVRAPLSLTLSGHSTPELSFPRESDQSPQLVTNALPY
jgi:hypothetical protein